MILRLRFRLVCELPLRLYAEQSFRPGSDAGRESRTGRGRRRSAARASLILDAGFVGGIDGMSERAGRRPGPGRGGLPGGVPPTVQGNGVPAGKAKHPRDGRARHGSWERAARPRNPSARVAGQERPAVPVRSSASSEGPQIEQSVSQDLPIAFRAFLAQRRVRKQSSHRAAFATASWAAGRHGFIFASASAASCRTRALSSWSKASARASAASGWHLQSYFPSALRRLAAGHPVEGRSATS